MQSVNSLKIGGNVGQEAEVRLRHSFVSVERFVEPTVTSVGERVFDVAVNGRTELKKFDVFAAAGGKSKGVERTFEGTAKEGYLNIGFKPLRGAAIVSSLTVVPFEQR